MLFRMGRHQCETLLHCPQGGGWSTRIVMSMSDCLTVCLSVCSHNSKTARPNSINFVHVACGRGPVLLWVAIRYVLPVSWMMSCFYATRSVGQNQARPCLEEIHQVAVPVGRQTTTVFGRDRQNTTLGGAKFAIYDWLVCRCSCITQRVSIWFLSGLKSGQTVTSSTSTLRWSRKHWTTSPSIDDNISTLTTTTTTPTSSRRLHNDIQCYSTGTQSTGTAGTAGAGQSVCR